MLLCYTLHTWCFSNYTTDNMSPVASMTIPPTLCSTVYTASHAMLHSPFSSPCCLCYVLLPFLCHHSFFCCYSLALPTGLATAIGMLLLHPPSGVSAASIYRHFTDQWRRNASSVAWCNYGESLQFETAIAAKSSSGCRFYLCLRIVWFSVWPVLDECLKCSTVS